MIVAAVEDDLLEALGSKIVERARPDLQVIREGKLPPRVLGLVIEWAELHQDELLENWTSLTASGTFKRIEPLV